MNIIALTTLAAFVILFALATVTLLNNPQKSINRLFAGSIYSLAGWVVVNYLADYDPARSLLWTRSAFVLQAMVVWLFLLFLINFPSEDRGLSRFTRLINILAGTMVVLSATPLITASVKFIGRSSTVEGGSLYAAYLIYYVIFFLACVYVLFRKLRRSRGIEKEKVKMILFGLILTGAIGLPLNLVLPFILGENSLAIYGGYSVVFLAGFTSYSIIRHKLFNIRAAVALSFAYLLSIGSVAFVYSVVVFGVINGVVFGGRQTSGQQQQVVGVIVAVLISFTFGPVSRFFQKITDRIFYKDRYDPQVLVSDIGRVLATEIELAQLSEKVLAIMDDQMRLIASNIVVTNKDGIFYQTHEGKIREIYHPADLAKFKAKPAITDELPSGERREILERHNVWAIFPLRTKESFVGYLLLGEKKSGDIFSGGDIQSLQIIANELAVAIQNARSYTEIQRFNETLREKIRQATADLRHANNELKALDKAKDEFISMASHQLRTPLTAVRGYTSMVMDGDFGRIGKEQKETLKQAFDAATRMTRLVDDLLNVSRIQSGKFRIEQTQVDLNKVLPEEISLIENTASTKSVEVTFHEPKQPVPVLSIDEGKTRQCFMNLMDNAIYYSSTAKGGGKVDVYLEADDKYVSFRVADNGIGVPKSEQAKLFKKFYRAPNAQQARPDGTGLGLFLVGRVVHDQGGEIIFESTEGKGSTFGFKLPIKPVVVKGPEGKKDIDSEKESLHAAAPAKPVDKPATPSPTKA